MDPVAGLALRAFLAWLLASAALAKLREPRAFVAALAGYRLLPAALAPAAAAALVAAELALAAGLWWPAARAAAALGAAALLVLYGAAIALNLARGRRDIDCGCGGPLGRRSLSEGLVLRNLALAGAALACALPETGRALVWLDGVTLAAAAFAAGCLYAASNALARAPVTR
jgi:hypothetical protein